MDFNNEVITILYGSQTGNSQDIAERIWRESKRYYYHGSVKSMDDYKILDLINEKCVIFVCSTTGQGEEPDNMKSFWRFLLRKNLPNNTLTNLRFAVLGLGDSSYVKFNFAAKRLNKRLIQLGARMLIPLGLGDDQHDMGYDAAVDPWIDSLWKELGFVFPLPIGIAPLENLKFEPRWFVSSKVCEPVEKPTQGSIYNSSRTQREFYVTLKDSIRTTSDGHFQDVRVLKLQSNGEKYAAGDVVVIRPVNSPQRIDEFFDVLDFNNVNLSRDTTFSISEKSSDMPLPNVLCNEITLEKLCEEYFDLSAIPRRHVFNILAQLTDSDLEKEKCLEFVSAEGQNDLYNYCNRPKRNIVEVLQDFPHATKNIKADMIFEILPPIKPREFSIASSCVFHQNEIHILLAVVKYKTKLLKARMGLCSNYLADLSKGEKISVWLKKGSFRFPTDKFQDSRIMMVGPGTGMAPFRNYIYECVAENTADSQRLTLFFGCRGENLDFHCKDELVALHDEKKLNLICAFSRDQSNKIYVQHKIIENGQLVWENLKQKKVFIFIAGNSKNMPQQVKEAFIEVLEKYGQKSKEEAVEFISEMERSGRYQTETWS